VAQTLQIAKQLVRSILNNLVGITESHPYCAHL